MTDKEKGKDKRKLIGFRPADHAIIQAAANQLTKERGTKVYLPPYVMEAVKFFEEHRK